MVDAADLKSATTPIIIKHLIKSVAEVLQNLF